MARLAHLIFILFMLFATSSMGQQFPSSCKMNKSFVNQFKEDIARLSVRKMRRDSALKDSIRIPVRLKDTIGKALAAVYNAQTPVTDSLFNFYNFHTFPLPETRHFSLSIDSTYNWVKHVQKGDSTVSQPKMDKLFKQFGLQVDTVYQFDFFESYTIKVEARQHYNLKPLLKRFKKINPVRYANSKLIAGDGNNIRYRELPQNQQLEFAIKWGDCPAGCMFQRVYRFRIEDDCAINLSRNGEPIPDRIYQRHQDTTLNNGNNNSLLQQGLQDSFAYVFPNPTTNEFTLEAIKPVGEVKVSVLTSEGTVIKQRLVTFNQVPASFKFDLTSYPGGVYFVTLINPNKQQLIKIIKKAGQY